MDSKFISFELYRYQLLPLKKQLELGEPALSTEQLIASKNKYFEEVLREDFKLDNVKTKHFVTKQEIIKSDLLVYRIALRRPLKRKTADFREEELDDYPDVLVIFYNDPSVQKIAIQQNYKVTTSYDPESRSRTRGVARILENVLSNHLAKKHLSIYIEPLFEENEFWSIIDEYPGSIQKITFDLISPNLANISKTISDQIKDMQKNTNSHKFQATLSNSKSCLDVRKSDENIESLVKYSAEGGGAISVKIKNMKHKYKTEKTCKEITIDEAVIKDLSGNADNVLEIIKGLLKDV